MERENKYVNMMYIPILIGGIWQPTASQKNKNKLRHKLYHFYAYATVLIFIYYVVCFFVRIFLPFADVKFLPRVVYSFILYFFLLLRLLVCRKRSVILLFEEILQTQRKIYGSGQIVPIAIYEGYAKKVKTIYKVAFYSMLAITIAFMVGCWQTYIFVWKPGDSSIDGKRPLPLMLYRPFDTDQHYYLGLFLDHWNAHITSMILISAECLQGGAIIFIICQLKILQYFFENFSTIASEMATGDNLEQAKIKLLGRCVRWQNRIAGLVDLYNETMRNVFFIEFFSLSAQFAFLLVFYLKTDLEENNIDATLVSYVSFAISSLIVTIVLYMGGQEVIEQSKAIADAAYMSNWENESSEIRKLLCLIIARSQRPLVLEVGYLYYMSAESLTKLLKSIYSCLILFNDFGNISTK